MMLTLELLGKKVSALPALDGTLSPRFALGPAPEHSLRLDHLDGPVLLAWLDGELERVAGADRKLAAAYLMGRLSWSLAMPLCGLALSGAWIAQLPPAAAAFSIRHVEWELDGKVGVAPVTDFWLDPAGSVFVAQTDETAAPVFQQAFETLVAPLVSAMNTYSNLPPSALWRLAGDSLSAGFLHSGKQLGCAERAMAIALPMMRAKGTPLHSRQTGFVEIRVPERPDISDWFRARGGCCRYYTADGGEYCTTCVLRDPESRDERLIDYLRRTHIEKVA